MSHKIFRLFSCILILATLLALPVQPAQASGPFAPNSLPTTPDWSGLSNVGGAHFGMVVAAAGDVNGDGYADVLISAPDFTSTLGGEGRVYLYLGSENGIPQYPPLLPNWWADGGQTGAHFGSSIAGIGDVNGDGYDDIAAAADKYDDGETDEGKIFVWYGSQTGLSCGAGCPVNVSGANWTAQTNQANAQLNAIAGGDVNNDGKSDLIAGAVEYDNGATANTGAVFVWMGSANGLNNGLPGTPSAPWKAFGSQVNTRLGYSVAAVDIKKDGSADVIASYITGNGAVLAWYAPLSGEGSPSVIVPKLVKS